MCTIGSNTWRMVYDFSNHRATKSRQNQNRIALSYDLCMDCTSTNCDECCLEKWRVAHNWEHATITNHKLEHITIQLFEIKTIHVAVFTQNVFKTTIFFKGDIYSANCHNSSENDCKDT